MSRAFGILVGLSMMSIVATGCGVEGSWVTRDVQPPEAKAAFNLIRVTFKPDMSYVAKAEKGGEPTDLKGTYAYDPWTKKLTLKTAGKERDYTAAAWWFGKELRIEKKMPDGKMMKATLRSCQGDKACEKCPHSETCQCKKTCPSDTEKKK